MFFDISNVLVCNYLFLFLSVPLEGYNLSHVMTKLDFAICEQQRRRSAYASAQSDQCLCCLLLR